MVVNGRQQGEWGTVPPPIIPPESVGGTTWGEWVAWVMDRQMPPMVCVVATHHQTTFLPTYSPVMNSVNTDRNGRGLRLPTADPGLSRPEAIDTFVSEGFHDAASSYQHIGSSPGGLHVTGRRCRARSGTYRTGSSSVGSWSGGAGRLALPGSPRRRCRQGIESGRDSVPFLRRRPQRARRSDLMIW